jgi:hypothetical protein
MAKPIKPSTDQQALIFDLLWRLRDATDQRNWKELDKLRQELRGLFDLNDRGLVAGRTIYQERLSTSNIPANFRDLPKSERRKLITDAYQKSLDAKTDDTQPAQRPDPKRDESAYNAWLDGLSLEERNDEIERLLTELACRVSGQQAQPIDDGDELVDADELATLKAMWGDDGKVEIVMGKPRRCPYCKGSNISGGMGHWDCDDCGRSGSY